MSAPLAGLLPDRTFRGVLFDMDGTLIDSTGAVLRSWVQWAQEYGVTREALAGSHGRTSINTIRAVMADRPEVEQLEAHARIRDLELADTEGVVALAGARETFELLDELGVPHAIVTSCERELAGVRIEAAGLPRPTVVVTATDVSHGKPGPEPYLLGASRVGLEPGACVVVEDATAGLVSGRAAGAGALVAVLGTTPAQVLAPDADVVYESIASVPWRSLVARA
ncbi:HAD-IA family hydrolase [Knoellia sp. LjRoot47]|uniref:HAD-IA family hydrolase n=1 Tax=Knoellia sp. LjRoot47 TaxID=3342330 RepID=UPI003ECC3532